MSTPISPWSDQTVESLTLWVSQGLSASQISNQFGQAGYRISRNAVIGKVHRLHLSVPNRPGRAESDRPRKRKPRPRQFGLVQTSVVRGKAEQPAVAATGPIRSRNPVKLEELERHHCRALLDSGLYCGNPHTINMRGEHSSYCTRHHALFNVVPVHPRARKAVQA